MPGRPHPNHQPQQYPDRMTVSAHDVAAAIRTRLPGCPVKKLHRLLYYAQGYHLAWFGEPLFEEPVSAWDTGPVVDTLWQAEENHEPAPPRAKLGERELNTIGYVCSRYGNLTGRDLEHLTRAEDPWRRADTTREPGGSAPIKSQWMHDYFLNADSDDEDESMPDPKQLAQLHQGALDRLREPVRIDDMEMIRRRLAARAG